MWDLKEESFEDSPVMEILSEEVREVMGRLIANSKEYTVSEMNDENKTILIVRGTLEKKVDINGLQVGTSTVRITPNSVILLWREGLLQRKFLIIVWNGVWNDNCGGKP